MTCYDQIMNEDYRNARLNGLDDDQTPTFDPRVTAILMLDLAHDKEKAFDVASQLSVERANPLPDSVIATIHEACNDELRGRR